MADISKINPNGTEYNLKDATARAGIASSKTLKSSVVTVTDASPINAEDITVDITPKQDLQGYDRPWAGGAWKNKLGLIFTEEQAFVVGVPFTHTDSSFTLKGTASSDGYRIWILSNPPSIPINTNCVFKVFIDKGSLNGAHLSLSFRKNNVEIKRAILTDNTQSVTFTVEDTYDNVRFIIESVTRGEVYDLEAKVQLELGSTPTSFAPYSNICPIEGWTGAELDRDGANLWDDSDTEYGYLDPQGVVQAHQGFESLNYREISPGNPYTLSFNRSASVSDEGMRVAWYDADKQFIKRDGILEGRDAGFKTTTATAPSNAKYARASICITNATGIKFYQGQQYTANFGETVHGGKWHVTKGGTDKTYGYVEFDGSDDEIWSLSGGGYRVTNSLIRDVVKRPSSGSATDIYLISNSFIQGSASDLYVGNVDGIGIEYDTGLFCAHYGGYKVPMTVADWKAYLASNPLQVVYELATPTTISTPKQNVPMLQGINTVSADCGDVTLKYQPDNVIGELKGEIEDIKDSAKVKGRYPIQSTASSGSYKFEIDVYRRGDIIGVDSFAFDRDQSCPSGYVSTVLPNVALNHYKPIEDAFFVFRHISGKGVVKITLRDDGQVGFSCYIMESMTGDVAQDGWLFEQNWIQLAADLFNN